MLNASTLSKPEGDEPLDNREPEGLPAEPTSVPRGKRVALDDVPRPRDLCRILEWTQGAEAALEAVTPAAARALAAPDGCACRHCWLKGRDAAIGVMEAA
jgi:hypothetical protein